MLEENLYSPILFIPAFASTLRKITGLLYFSRNAFPFSEGVRRQETFETIQDKLELNGYFIWNKSIYIKIVLILISQMKINDENEPRFGVRMTPLSISE